MKRSTATIWSASLITVGATILSRPLGFWREALVADLYGTTAALDRFVLAFTIPEFITYVLTTALPLVIIPRRTGDQSDNRLMVAGGLNLTLALVIVAALLTALRYPLIELIAPSLSGTERESAVQLFGLLVWFTVARGIEAFFRSWLLANKRFVVPAFAPLVLNLVVISLLYLTADSFSILSLARAWVAGAVGSALLTTIVALVVLRPDRLVWWDSRLVGVARALVLVASFEMVALTFPVIDRLLGARYLAEGGLAAIYYAFFLTNIPLGVLGTTLVLATLPWIADFVRLNDVNRLRSLFVRTTRNLWFIFLFVGGAVALLAPEVVTVAFRRGAFDLESVSQTAGPVQAFALGMPAYAIMFFGWRYYYTRRNYTRLGTVLIGILLAKLGLSFALVGTWDVVGLAVATTIAWWLGAVYVVVNLSRSLGASLRDFVDRHQLALVTIAGVSLLGIGIGDRFWALSADASLWLHVGRLAALGGGGALVYFGLASLLGIPEADRFWQRLRGRDQREPSESVDKS